MNRTTTSFPRPRLAWPVLLAALAMVTTPSCDNPACVFAENGCQELPGGGVNAFSSTFPATGETVLPGGPRVTNVFPSGNAHPESPIVVVFNESVSPESVEDAFVLRSTAGLGNTAQPAEALIGDGRVLVLIPPPLVPGQSYELTYADDGAIRDLSGAGAVLANGAVVGSFTIDSEPGDNPQVLMTWPFNGANNVSTITQVVTVFDRTVFIPSISGSSWELKINDAAPTTDALPSALVINSGIGSGGQAVPDSRIWMWESIDPDTDQRVTLGEISVVDLTLSKEDHKIITPSAPGVESFEMAETNISFTTANISAPQLASITSTPNDAIGIRNLTVIGDPDFSLEITVVLEEQPVTDGEVLEIFLVGQNPNGTESGVGFISRQRSQALSAGTNTAILYEDDLRLVTATTPLTAEFLDGEVGIGFYLRRGDQRSAMRVLDVDLDTPGIQDPRLDLQAPQFVSLFGEDDSETEFMTDLLELSVAGVASEEPNAVLVTATIGGTDYDNRDMPTDPPPPVATSRSNGTFVARPVDVGQVGMHTPSTLEVIVYDRALNASNPVYFDYTQRGGSGPGTGAPGGGNVEVVVYNQRTLQPVAGALVVSQGYDVGGAYDATFGTQTGTTNTEGFVTMPTIGSGEPVFTVQATGYDLFTFQGVPTTRLEIPLTPSNPVLATVPAGLSAEGEELSSNFIHNFLADSRAILPGATVEEADMTSYNSLLNRTICTFGDANLVRSHEIGLVTALSTKDPLNLDVVGDFSAQTYLLAFELDYPRTPITPPILFDGLEMTISEYLSGPGVGPEDVPQGTAAQEFEEPANFATDFPALVGSGPTVSVEALTYGLRGMMTVGLGLAYENSGGPFWDIRSSYSARAKTGGEFVEAGMIENDRFLRVELADANGNRSGVRQPMSVADGTMTPPQVPGLVSNVTVPNGPSYDLTCKNVLIDTGNPTAVAGLYRTLLVDGNGRRWHIWTLDAQDGVDIITHVPPIEEAPGGVGLMDGNIACFTDAWAWDGFDPMNFLFSDILRRHEEFASSEAESFTQ